MTRRIIVLAVSTAVVLAAVTLSLDSFAGANPQTNNRALDGSNVGTGNVRTGGHASHNVSPSTKHKFYTLAASAFAPDGLHSTTEDYFNEWDPANLSNQDSGRCFNVGLDLPIGATLVSVTVYYTAGSTAMYFEINEQNLAAATATDLVSFDTTAESTPTRAQTTADFAAGTVVSGKMAYSSGVCPNGNTTFSGFSIEYNPAP